MRITRIQRARRSGVTGYLDDLAVELAMRGYQLRQHPVLVTFALVGLIAVAGGLVSYWRAPAQPVAPLVPVAAQVAQASPTAAPAVPTSAAQPVSSRSASVLQRAVVAYDAPGGQVLGAVEAGREYALLAWSGQDWLQADVEGAGQVWLRSAELLGQLPNVATPTAAPTSAPAPAPAAPAAPRGDYTLASSTSGQAELAQQQVAPTMIPTITADQAPAIYANACAGREVEVIDGITWVCSIGEADGQVYWIMQ